MQKTLYFLALLTIALLGCNKDTDLFIPDTEPQPARVVASVLGVVTDDAGEPVSNADVWLESNHATTNDAGLFLFVKKEMSEDAYVRVEKQGYFNGSRRFYPIAGHTANVKIQLLNATTTGTFQNSGGGTITVNGGTTINFPADAVARTDGQAYSGMVQVSAFPLYTDDANLQDRMPGDLVGRNESGQLRALGSYGMIAVELRDDAGSLLQVAEGKEVEIRLTIADDQLGSAPSEIPLWYFDENSGLWKEEGSAMRSGNNYIMKVKHFSFWNCDASFPLITLTGSVVYANGDPGVGLSVCISVPAWNIIGYGITDGDGVFSGKVPKDQELVVTVKTSNGCEILEFPVTVGPFSDDVTIPPIVVDFTTEELTQVTGSIVDCNGDPVVNGLVELGIGYSTWYYYLEDDNTFSASFYNCDENPVTAKGFDYANGKESLPVTLSAAPVIDFGEISVCEDLTEYLRVFADNQTIEFAFLGASTNQTGSMSTRISGSGLQDSTSFFYLLVPGITLGTYNIGGSNGGEVYLNLQPGTNGHIESGTLTFTYYGEVGDFIMGTMEGTYVETVWQTQMMTSYPFTGEFKILRD